MRKLFLVLGVIVWFASLNVFAASTRAESYDVKAAVPYPVSTLPAVIDPSLSNSIVSVQTVAIFGTCQYMTPVTILSIWRDTTFLGSTSCNANGTYRLDIDLNVGLNSLIARSSNISGQYGPNSTPLSITYNPPQAVVAPVQNTTPTQAAEVATPVVKELTVESAKAFELLPDSKKVSVTLKVEGGSGPYIVVLNWGDGSEETRTVDKPGEHTFVHEYVSLAVYKVFARVTDVLGAIKNHQFVVVTSDVKSAAASTGKVDPNAQSNNLTETACESRWLKTSSILLGSVVLWVVSMISFLTGRRYQIRVFDRQQKRAIAKNNLKSKK